MQEPHDASLCGIISLWRIASPIDNPDLWPGEKNGQDPVALANLTRHVEA